MRYFYFSLLFTFCETMRGSLFFVYSRDKITLSSSQLKNTPKQIVFASDRTRPTTIDDCLPFRCKGRGLVLLENRISHRPESNSSSELRKKLPESRLCSLAYRRSFGSRDIYNDNDAKRWLAILTMTDRSLLAIALYRLTIGDRPRPASAAYAHARVWIVRGRER